MSGLDNMKRRILDEANHSAEGQIAKAQAQAEDILREAREKAHAEAERISLKSREDAVQYAEKVASSCEMERKQAILKAKQEVIREVLDKAYESVMNLDTNSYFDMIRNMLRKHVLSQKGNIYFSAADMRRMPEGFQEEICRIAEEKGGELTIITEEREIGGGFILAYGKVEENCTIKALFHAKRDELSDKVNEVLFI